MKEVVINVCFGGFGLSYAGMMEYARLKGIELYGAVDGRDENGRMKFGNLVPYDGTGSETMLVHYSTKPIPDSGKIGNEDYFSDSRIERDDPLLIRTVKNLGKGASGRFAELKIVEIPDGVAWEIDEYDGNETVHEVHRSWS